MLVRLDVVIDLDMKDIIELMVVVVFFGMFYWGSFDFVVMGEYFRLIVSGLCMEIILVIFDVFGLKIIDLECV